MSETSGSQAGGTHAGDVGARRATVGEPTDEMSVNVPPTRPEALENAREAQAARTGEETFVPEPPSPDERIPADDDGVTAMDEDVRVAPRSASSTNDDVRMDEPPPSHAVSQEEIMSTGPIPDPAVTPEERQAREQVQQTREQVGTTVSALADKTDIKHRLQEVTPEKVVEEAKKRPKLLIAAAGVVAMVVLRRLMRRGKK
ncbi:MAG: DUF3618 domain-containing protein [Thermoactinospora sp.]|nr:DUF3618 domain-containing protein [Thermoactinospora sp.]